MSILYYDAIYNNRENKADMVKKVSESNFNMFSQYIEHAIEAQMRKKVSISWRATEGAVIKLNQKTTCFTYNINEEIVFSIPKNIYKINCLNGIIEIIENNTLMLISNTSIPENIIFNRDNIIKCNDDIYISLAKEIDLENIASLILNNNTLINLEKIKLDLNFNEIYQKNNSNFKVENICIQNDKCKVKFSGQLKDSEPLIISNFLEVDDWNIIKNNNKSPIKFKNGNKLNIIKENIGLVYTDDKIDENTELFIDNSKIDFKIIKENNKPNKIIYNGNYYDLYLENKVQKIIIDDKINFGKYSVYDEMGIEFEALISRDYNNSNSVKIELIDDEEDSEEMFTSFSKIDYFMGDDAELVTNGEVVKIKGRENPEYREFRIKSKNKNENTIELEYSQVHKYMNKKLTINDLPQRLYLPINTYQLEKQKESLERIKNTPLIENKGILSLVESKKFDYVWKKFNQKSIKKWYVLTDDTRDGTEKQREFVEKAISTSDYMLLEGPPGSGKTTAIIELIIQLIKENKKILLSSSTHVAIDNVLERIKELNLMGEIFPLRIGDKRSVSDSVREYVIGDILNKDNKIYHDLLLESANLVCGTTMGILQHPHFKNADKNRPIVPEFDYLIMDESSKTTFQEFLVPSLYAKRWVLVGDIKQLSPFTDREHIEANLSQFGKAFNINQQQASLLIFKYIKKFKMTDKNFAVVKVDSDVIKCILDEIKAKCDDEVENIHEKLPYIGFIVDTYDKVNMNKLINILSKDEIVCGSPKSWMLPGLSVIFVESSIYDEISKYIPVNKLHFNVINWNESKSNYRSNYYYDTSSNKIYIYNRGRKINTSEEIVDLENQYLREKTWAKEVAWRIVRKYELRLSNKNTKNIEVDIESLIPTKDNEIVSEKVNIIQSIALPSTLESLQIGVPKFKEFKHESVLNSGFREEDLKNRHIRLDYQQRMHPDISVFPREQFYKNEALKDSNMIRRDWSFNRYDKRSIWLDVKGNTYRSNNKDEVKAMIKELKEFIIWAKQNPKGDNEPWSVACLTFYKGQEKLIREALRDYTGMSKKVSQFEKDGIKIYLYTIDKFQGREADVTYISMVQTRRVGFLDSPNRLNVAMTRARYQRVIIGDKSYFENQKESEELRELSKNEDRVAWREI